MPSCAVPVTVLKRRAQLARHRLSAHLKSYRRLKFAATLLSLHTDD